MLAHLLRKARAEAVRREFRATPAASYTERHDVTLLVRLHITVLMRHDGSYKSRWHPDGGRRVWRSQCLLVGAERGAQATCTSQMRAELMEHSTAAACPEVVQLCLLQAGTYNVNGRPPPPGLDLRPWLDAGAGADIVAVALQECVPLSASNVVMGAPRVED